MDNWDSIWGKIISDSNTKEEYRKAFLLNLFQKTCSKMNNNACFRTHIMSLYRQSFDKIETTKLIIQKEFLIELSTSDSNFLNTLLNAYFSKNEKRKTIPQSEKEKLFKDQNGVCNSCNQLLGNNWKKIHVDHVIPWILVGDELPDNFQLLCETCNKCKNSKTDYIFKNLIKLN